MPNQDIRPLPFEEFLASLAKGIDTKKESAPVVKAAAVYSVPDIETTVFNGDTTIVLWKDGRKTIVTKEPDKPYDPYSAFCAAVCKRLFGGTDKVMRVIERTDKASIARKKAEAAALQKAKNREAQEELHQKAEERRAKEYQALLDAMIDHYLLEAEAKKRVKEILAAGDLVCPKMPFDEGEGNEQ